MAEDQNDLFMHFEDFVEEDDDDGSDEESTDDDSESWEDASSTTRSSEGEDDGDVGEQGEVDVRPPPAAGAGAGAGRRAPRLQPYQHEPLPREDDEGNDGDAHRHDVDPQRLLNNNWCQCGGHCHVEPSFSAGDCICCREIPEVASEADALEVDCLTTTEAFEAAILNPISLYIGWLEYTDRWRQAARCFANRNNEKYRYVAYRKVVRWCWGFLGRDVRVQLPACIHARIMRAYPDAARTYKGTVLRVLRR